MDSPLSQVRKYLHALYQRRYLFLVTAVTAALLVVIGSFFSPKKYEAKSTVFIEQNVVNNLMKGLTVTPSMGDRIRVLRYHMLSRDIILRVLKKLDMDVKLKTSEALEGLVQKCQETTTINLKGEDLFFVSFIDTDPKFAKDYINTLVNTYVEENLSAKREESFGANRFLSEQVAFYKQKLDKIEDEINNFRKKTGIFSSVTETSIIEEIKTYEDELKKLKLEKNEKLAAVSTIQQQLAMMKKSSSSKEDPFSDILGTSGADTRIEALKSQLEELLLVYNEQFPAVIRLKELITELEKKQQKEQNRGEITPEQDFNPLEDPVFVDLKMRINTIQSDLNSLQAREEELLTQVENNKRTLENFPQDKKLLADMERERTANKNVYETLLERVGIAEVSKQMEVTDKSTTFRIVDPAILPTFPVGIKRLFKMLLGLFFGIGIGATAVVIREKLDDTIKSADAVRSFGVAVLAEIPLMFDQRQVQLERKKDKIVYSYASICLLFVFSMICHDLFGLTVIDQFIAHIQLDVLVPNVIDLIR